MRLLALPPELLHELLLRLDPPALRALAATCRALRDAAAAEPLWRALLERRFRARAPHAYVTPHHHHHHTLHHFPNIPRAPRDVYVQWHRQQRPPAVRPNAAPFDPFARTVRELPSRRAGGSASASASTNKSANASANASASTSTSTSTSPDASAPASLLWATVRSADDCRVGPQGLLLRVVLQNIGIAPIVVAPWQTSIMLTTGREIHALRQYLPSSDSAAGNLHLINRLRHHFTSGAEGNSSDLGSLAVVPDDFTIDRAANFVAGDDRKAADGPTNSPQWRRRALPERVVLCKDDFLVIHVRVRLVGVVHEVDAVERLNWIGVPVQEQCCTSSWTGAPMQFGMLRAKFEEHLVWDRYQRMPGGWWVRRDVNAPSRRG